MKSEKSTKIKKKPDFVITSQSIPINVILTAFLLSFFIFRQPHFFTFVSSVMAVIANIIALVYDRSKSYKHKRIIDILCFVFSLVIFTYFMLTIAALFIISV